MRHASGESTGAESPRYTWRGRAWWDIGANTREVGHVTFTSGCGA